jgi:hypothetical protein
MVQSNPPIIKVVPPKIRPRLQGGFQEGCDPGRLRLADNDIGRPMPLGQAVKRGSQVSHQPFGDPYAWFHMQGFDLEHPLRAMRLGIRPADEPWPSQNQKLRSFVHGFHGLDGRFAVFRLFAERFAVCVVRVIRVQRAVFVSDNEKTIDELAAVEEKIKSCIIGTGDFTYEQSTTP